MFHRLQFTRRSRKFMTVFAVCVAALAMLIVASPASANIIGDISETAINTFYSLLANVVIVWVSTVGLMVALLSHILVVVSAYNEFITVDVVEVGWSLVRDITNMFFIIALLVIAAGTILRIENYRYNRLLAKVILMAFLVNFSRLIAGFLIQSAQVVTITFVNAYRDALFGNLAELFGITKILSFASDVNSFGEIGTDLGTILGSLVAGLAVMITAFVVTLAYVIVFAVRIVTLWILVIMSPFAFASRILPNTEGFYRQWWQRFGKAVVMGPVAAFFLWLSLAIVVSTGTTSLEGIGAQTEQYEREQETIGQAPVAGFANEIFSLQTFTPFLIAVIFMMTGLRYAVSSSEFGGQWAMKFATGAALGASGINFVRDRTIRPIQGYLATRRQMQDNRVRQRAETLTAFADRRTAGSLLASRGTREQARAAAQRYEKQRSDTFSRERGLDLRTDQQLNQDLAVARSPRERDAIVQELQRRGGLSLQNTTHAQALQEFMNNKRYSAQQRDQLLDQIEKQNVGTMTVQELRTMAASGIETSMRNAITELERRKQLDPANAGDVGLINQYRASVQNLPQRLGEFDDALKRSNPRMALETIYNGFRNGAADINRMIEDINQGKFNDKNLTRRDFAQMRVQLERADRFSPDQARSYYANQIASASRTAEELQQRIENLRPDARNAAFNNANLTPANLSDDKQRVIAEGGFIDEAYLGDQTRSRYFVSNNAGRVAQLAKDGRLSRRSITNGQVMQEMMDNRRIGRSVLNEAAKANPETRELLRNSALRVVQTMNADAGAVADNSERGRRENSRRETLMDLAEGGQVRDAAGNEVSILDVAYDGLQAAQQANARHARQSAIRRAGDSFTRSDTTRMTNEALRDFVIHATPAALFKIADRNPDLAKEMADRKRLVRTKSAGDSLYGEPLDQDDLDSITRQVDNQLRRNDRGI